jgi:hypothetical protein
MDLIQSTTGKQINISCNAIQYILKSIAMYIGQPSINLLALELFYMLCLHEEARLVFVSNIGKLTQPLQDVCVNIIFIHPFL